MGCACFSSMRWQAALIVGHRLGKLGFSVLLFQDMPVIPTLSFITFLSDGGPLGLDESRHQARGVFGMLVGGRYLLCVCCFAISPRRMCEKFLLPAFWSGWR
ncbi:hypothetical protein [Sodalis sp.]|uniref:hypothetical protein n=1 Tax=Sodalis sp. (in: enterobacteria) TaxID=1898979 RepID=UPI003873ADBB